jgi:hypothetical protein
MNISYIVGMPQAIFDVGLCEYVSDLPASVIFTADSIRFEMKCNCLPTGPSMPVCYSLFGDQIHRLLGLPSGSAEQNYGNEIILRSFRHVVTDSRLVYHKTEDPRT